MNTVTLANGRTFEAPPAVSILDAAAQAGVVLEHSCRTGRCGTCRAHVAAGTTATLLDETGLTVQEVADGQVLTCARTATSPVTLDIEDLRGLEGIATVTLPCRVAALVLRAADVLQVTLRLPPAARFAFRAGQYVDVIGPGGVARSYSLASAPSRADRLDLHIRRVPGGAMSAYWFEQARPEHLLRLRGPLGTFFLRDLAGLELVFLATGTGLAPILSMLHELSTTPEAARPTSITLLWGGRHPPDLYLDPLANAPGLRFVPVLSQATDEWTGARGHVQDVLLRSTQRLDHSVVYACGSDAMIHSARTALLTAGLPARRFFSDAFVSSG